MGMYCIKIRFFKKLMRFLIHPVVDVVNCLDITNERRMLVVVLGQITIFPSNIILPNVIPISSRFYGIYLFVNRLGIGSNDPQKSPPRNFFVMNKSLKLT